MRISDWSSDVCSSDLTAIGRIKLPHRALDFRMAGMADQDHFTAFSRIELDLDMDLGDQRAGRIEDRQLALARLLTHRLRNAVRRENASRTFRHFIDFLDEHRALGAQTLDDETVMHDFMTHIDRRTQHFERTLDDLDCPIDSSPKAARMGKQNITQDPAFPPQPPQVSASKPQD